jgi:PAS domain S-box-containing protein
VNTRDDSQIRLQQEIALLRQRVEDAEEMRRAICEGEVDGFVCGPDDDRKHVRLLNHEWERYRDILEKVRDGTVTVSCDGEILYANQQFIDMLGENLNDIFNVALERYIPSSDHNRLLAFLGCGIVNSTLDTALLAVAGEPLPVKLTIASFSHGYASLIVTPLVQRLDAGLAEETLSAIRSGQIDAFVVGDGQVLTLSTAHRPWAIAMDQLAEGTATVSAEGDVVYANQGFASMLGLAREEVLGASFAQFAEDVDRAPLLAALKGNETVRSELRLRRADGAPLEVLLRATPLGEGGNACVVLSDLTERRSHEALRELDKRKTEFIATLSHELRDPLGAIRTALALLDRSPELGAKDRFAVDLISRQAGQIMRLVDDLLDITKIEQGIIELRRERVDLRSVVELALESAMPLLKQRGHRLDVSLPEEAVAIVGDHHRLCQAVVNLLANAARYTPPGGRVSVHLGRTHAYEGAKRAVIRVRDNGVGIAQDQLAAIFEPFVKAQTADGPKSGGLGLGLTLCRRLVELHGGRLEAFSEGVGKGAEMVVHLPVAAE